MIIVEKNPGQKIDYEVNKTKLTFDDDLTLNLAKREEDYAVHIDVCFDEDGALCIGAAAGRSYVAQIDIPPRQYKEVPATAAETTTGEAADDADGSHTPQQTTAREPLPLDIRHLRGCEPQGVALDWKNTDIFLSSLQPSTICMMVICWRENISAIRIVCLSTPISLRII